MKFILALTLIAMLVACALAAAPGVDTGKKWKSSYQHLTRKRAALSRVDRVILTVLRQMTSEQTSLRKAISRALTQRNNAHSRRRAQKAVVNRLRNSRIQAEATYNARRKQEQSAISELKVREKIHREKMRVYSSTHARNTVEISRLDREKRILSEVRRLLGNNRASRLGRHRDHADINKANKHVFNNYQDKNSKFHHGAQRFTGNGWVHLSYVNTSTKTLLGVNLRGVTATFKQIKLVNRGTILDWAKGSGKVWTSFGFDLSKIVFKVRNKKTNAYSYIAVQTPYHKCGLDKLASTKTDFKVLPAFLKSKSGPVATCYRASTKVNNCFNQLVLDTTIYQPVGILDVETLGKCWTADNALKFSFNVYGH